MINKLKNLFKREKEIEITKHYKIEVNNENTLEKIRDNYNICPKANAVCICNKFIDQDEEGVCEYGAFRKVEVLD